MDFIDKLKNIVKTGTVEENVSMKDYCSFKTGGNADYIVSPGNSDEIKLVIEESKKENMPFVIIGNGSNIVVSDKGIRGVVIRIGCQMSKITENNGEFISQAGAMLSAVSYKAYDTGYSGFEFASGIPGSFGGAVCMNAGAYGGEMKDVIKWVKVMDMEGNIKTLSNEEMDFGYRRSVVSEKGYIVLEGCISLEKGDKEEIKALMADFNGRRRDKQPLNYPSAGSTFKRPYGHFAGKLIEDCGLKGYTVGGAMVSDKHAGFVVNKGGATTEDILNVIEHCQKEVFDKFGIKLETEVKIIGEF